MSSKIRFLCGKLGQSVLTQHSNADIMDNEMTKNLTRSILGNHINHRERIKIFKMIVKNHLYAYTFPQTSKSVTPYTKDHVRKKRI